MTDDVVLIEHREPGIALITLNRPARLNAWNGPLATRYFELLDQAAADPAVKVIVVTGAGRGFCAGADMETLQGIGASSGSGGAESAAGGRPQYHTTLIPKPVIAAVNGACAGIGMVQARLMELAPQPLMSRDNVRSMRADNVASGAPQPWGREPTSLETIAPGYLGSANKRARFAAWQLRRE